MTFIQILLLAFAAIMVMMTILWLISIKIRDVSIVDLFWGFGFVFEAGGDIQLARFKANPVNKGKVLDTGFWHYTRHPNYFGDAAVLFGYALICISAGSCVPWFPKK